MSGYTVGINVFGHVAKAYNVDPYEAEEHLEKVLRRTSDGHGTDLQTGDFDATWTYATKTAALRAIGKILEAEPHVQAFVVGPDRPPKPKRSEPKAEYRRATRKDLERARAAARKQRKARRR